MDPLSAFSIATGVVTFVDFGAKLISLYRGIGKSEDGRPAAISALEVQSQQITGNASSARAKIANLQARYPHQFEQLTRLAAECEQAEKEMRSLVGSLTSHHGTRDKARVAFRAMRKKDDVEALQQRLKSIREQTMMSVMMCVL
jgi:hypothetical protein